MSGGERVKECRARRLASRTHYNILSPFVPFNNSPYYYYYYNKYYSITLCSLSVSCLSLSLPCKDSILAIVSYKCLIQHRFTCILSGSG